VAGELPARIDQVQRCAVTREQAARYEAVARRGMERIEASRGIRAGDGRDLAGAGRRRAHRGVHPVRG
jgi:hypothetical protein